MGTFVFLSYSGPIERRQRRFVELLDGNLRERGLEPRTLGVTEYDSDSPLRAVRRVLLETNGLLTVAFRRMPVDTEAAHRSTHVDDGRWTTSPWCHIEAALAFERGLPVLVLREAGVVHDGVLRAGALNTGTVEFDPSTSIPQFFRTIEWRQSIDRWQHHVREVVERKGFPPRLY